ncbi:MAG: efflux RND transporter periplasmic adaptor subunit [Polyangiaceae bacterium]
MEADSPPTGRKGSTVAFVVAGALLGSLATYGILARTRHEVAHAPEAFHVDGTDVAMGRSVPMHFDTAPVELGEPLPRVPVTARVETVEARTAPSFAPLDGRVAEVAVHIGDKVKEKDRLVLVRSGDLAGMERERRAAELSIRTKAAMVERTKRMVESRAAPDNDLLVAESELEESRLAAAAANSKLHSLAVSQAGDTGYWVLANRAGTVVQIDAQPGKQVGPDKDRPVATVSDLDEVRVIADVGQREASSLAPGLAVSIRPPGGASFATGANDSPVVMGTVESVSDVLDPDRQTVPIRVRVDNRARKLRPHEFVEATFAPPSADRVLQVPADAVVSDGATSVVFVETRPGVVSRRPVRLGRQTRERAEIVDGVTVGERVVARGALLLLNAVEMKR